MTRRILRSAIICLLWALSLVVPAAEPQLVVVTSASSKLGALATLEVRRLYLGIPLVIDGHEVIPYRNTAEPAIQEVFLQHVVFMSSQAYDRHMAARVFRAGGTRMREYANLNQLVEALNNEPWSVTYMSPGVAASLPGIKVIARL